MEATISKQFSLEEPIDKVWAALSNPVEISSCVPGASITDQIDEKNYKGEVSLKFGPVKSKYDGQITIEESDDVNLKQITPIKYYVEEVMEDLLIEGLFLISVQGGRIYDTTWPDCQQENPDYTEDYRMCKT